MKSVTLLGVTVALVLATATVQAETVSTIAEVSNENSATIPAPLVAGLILLTLGLIGIKLARRKLSRLNWDSLD